MWLVATLRKWDTAFERDERSAMIMPFPIKFVCESIGFCEVFDDYDKALEAAGGRRDCVWGIAFTERVVREG